MTGRPLSSGMAQGDSERTQAALEQQLRGGPCSPSQPFTPLEQQVRLRMDVFQAAHHSDLLACLVPLLCYMLLRWST